MGIKTNLKCYICWSTPPNRSNRPWDGSSLPSWSCGFDSRRPLRFFQLTVLCHRHSGASLATCSLSAQGQRAGDVGLPEAGPLDTASAGIRSLTCGKAARRSIAWWRALAAAGPGSTRAPCPVTAPAGYHPLSGTPGARFKRIVGCRDMDVRCPGLLLGAAMRLAATADKYPLAWRQPPKARPDDAARAQPGEAA